MNSRRLPSVVVAVSFVSLASLAGCSSADTEDRAGATDAPLASPTTTFVVPVDERARHLCHDEINRRYCDAAAATRAVGACLAKIGATGSPGACAAGGPACVRTETVAESCVVGGEVYPDAPSCAIPRPRSCHFYSACLEKSAACGDDGYALGYGERYCYAFKNTPFSSKGVAWRDSVMVCLQRRLVAQLSPAKALTCGELTDFAFDSHPGCYTQPGTSICFLPPGDLSKVFGTIGLNESLQARTRAQITRVIGTCLGQLSRRFFLGAHVADAPAGALAPRSVGGDLSADAADATAEEMRASYAFWTAKADEYDVAR